MADLQHMTAAVLDVRKQTSKKGEYAYIDLRTQDGEEHAGVHWDGAPPDEVCEVGVIVNIDYEEDNYKGERQVKIKRITLAPDADVKAFLPHVDKEEHSACLKIISSSVDEISHSGLREFTKFCIREWWNLFREGTGAIKNHHALVGGYVKHVAEMICIADRLIEEYIGLPKAVDEESRDHIWVHPRTLENLDKQLARQLDADLVRCALPLHDWGKLEEYGTKGATFVMTKVGELLSHPGITPWRLAELRRDYHEDLKARSTMAGDTEDADALTAEEAQSRFIDDDLFGELLHVIGAHHGQVRYNAPSAPKMIAAMIVHIADYASCFMDVQAQQAYASGERGEFTDDRYPNPDYWKPIMRS